MPKFIQFAHPGGEHKPSSGNYINWNKGEHLRKFIETEGSWLDGAAQRRDGIIWLWCEWEPESEIIHRFKRTNAQLPHNLWRPYWVPKDHYAGCVNTDPLVFGGFYYSDCRQSDNRGLRDLPAGSVIIFGSPVGGEWVVDTVFVVAKRASYDVIYYDRLNKSDIDLPDGYEQVVLARTCGVLTGERERTLYVGATYEEPFDGMFSFFPCQPKPDDVSAGFPRPAIHLPEIYFNPNLAMAAGGASAELPRSKVKELWLDVKRQILEQGLYLGISAPFPPKRDAQRG